MFTYVCDCRSKRQIFSEFSGTVTKNSLGKNFHNSLPNLAHLELCFFVFKGQEQSCFKIARFCLAEEVVHLYKSKQVKISSRGVKMLSIRYFKFCW